MNPRKRRVTIPYRTIVTILIIGGGWFAWKSFRLPRPKPTPPPAAATRAPARATNAPVPGATARVEHPSPAQPQPALEPLPEPKPEPEPRAASQPKPVEPPPIQEPHVYPRQVATILEAQVALARQALSPGVIDGLAGPQTAAALRAFQARNRLPVAGRLDESKKTQLILETQPFREYTVTSNDVARLQPLSSTWLGKSRQTALEYETVLELLAEKGQCHPALIRQLNPAVEWAHAGAGTCARIPDIAPVSGSKASLLRISLSGKYLEIFDANTYLIAHFPCSIAQRVEKRPVGELHVAAIAPNPNYTFDPEVFPESAEARQIKTKLVLPPGPNNPVGVAWIGLDRPGYGIHGTPSPEQVGRTESHGCFRLANWNAEYLLNVVSIGTPLQVEP